MSIDFHKQSTFPGDFGKNENLQIKMPKMIGAFKIESLLETGGMSLLYLGTHPETKEPATIKVLSPKYLVHPEMIERFKNEAHIISMTNHPNIIQLYAYDEWENGLYIAMEYVQGISLRQFILQNPISLSKALDIIIDIAYALCHLHAHGVIHRDLKPENILITEKGEIKVIDFGIAQLLTAEEKPGDKPQFIGTPIYMSPEQRENPNSVSYPSDLYALGIILYELVLGKLCFGQIHLSLMPKGLQKILSKLLQPKPEDRYQDVVDFIADISNYRASAALQRDRKPSDPLSEMIDNMKSAQMALLVEKAPEWEGIEIGFAGHLGIGASGIYYDFLELPEGSYGFILGESYSKGAKGMIYTAVLRGMTRALCRFTTKPVELMTVMNDILCRDCMQEQFAVNYLILSPKTEELRYISCGYGSLWQIKSEEKLARKIDIPNPALGTSKETEFTEITQPWKKGDSLFLNTFAAAFDSKSAFTEEMLKLAIEENVDRPPQKEVENILFRAKLSVPKFFNERSVSLISILRLKE